MSIAAVTGSAGLIGSEASVFLHDSLVIHSAAQAGHEWAAKVG